MLMHELFAYMSSSLSLPLSPRHFNDVRLCASEKKISNSLGWEQKVSLQEGLELTASWYKQHAIKYWGQQTILAQLSHQRHTTTTVS